MDVKIHLAVDLRSDGRVWVGQCPSIDIASQAPTKRAALRRLREAIERWFASCIGRNALDEALSDSGFTRLRANEKLPEDTPNIVVTRDFRESTPRNRCAESPAINFAVKRRSGQEFLEGYMPATLARGGPYSRAAVWVDRDSSIFPRPTGSSSIDTK